MLAIPHRPQPPDNPSLPAPEPGPQPHQQSEPEPSHFEVGNLLLRGVGLREKFGELVL